MAVDIVNLHEVSQKWKSHPVTNLFLATRADSLRARAYTLPYTQNDNDQITIRLRLFSFMTAVGHEFFDLPDT